MDRSISFIVTGFGPFCNVKENPTTYLVDKLVDYLDETERQRNDGGGGGGSGTASLAASTSTLVIETSSIAARQQVDALHAELVRKKMDGTNHHHVTILLHLGVDECGRNFQVETCAYNEANFRVPDEGGHQPRHQRVVDGSPIGTPLTTLIDVPALVKLLNATNAKHGQCNATAVASSDPGRFVCNYIYCYSLDKFQCSTIAAAPSSQSMPNIRCLFIHVPPFAVVPESEQLRFVANLMEALAGQVRSAF